jgi:hypothetical protein
MGKETHVDDDGSLNVSLFQKTFTLCLMLNDISSVILKYLLL